VSRERGAKVGNFAKSAERISIGISGLIARGRIPMSSTRRILADSSYILEECKTLTLDDVVV
jgi:hypothetical protein